MRTEPIEKPTQEEPVPRNKSDQSLDRPSGSIEIQRQRTIGLICGLVSAVSYTAANVCLRYVSELDSFFVSAIRALPTFFIVLPMLMLRAKKGESIWRGRHQIPALVVVGIAGQLLGNVGFQASLGTIGLAIAVPIILGSMIIAGAIVGWVVLGERVDRQTGIGISMLLVALASFALGANANQKPKNQPTAQQNWDENSPSEQTGSQPNQSGVTKDYTLKKTGAFGIAIAILLTISGGVSYAVMGLVMRRSFQQGMLPEYAMLILSLVGFTMLSGISFFRLNWEQLFTVSLSDWIAMLMAGTFNGIAFFALSIALAKLNLVSVHMLNASQAAMALLAGVVLFGEPLSAFLPIGLLLTFVGLFVAGYRPEKSKLRARSKQNS